jgi:hydrogenase maturation factor
MADASHLGVKIFEEKIHVRPETAMICEFFQIDPLQLIASGSLLIAAKPNLTEKVMSALRKNNVEAAIIGEFLSSPEKRSTTRKDGKTCDLVRPTADHLWSALKHGTAT